MLATLLTLPLLVVGYFFFRRVVEHEEAEEAVSAERDAFWSAAQINAAPAMTPPVAQVELASAAAAGLLVTTGPRMAPVDESTETSFSTCGNSPRESLSTPSKMAGRAERWGVEERAGAGSAGDALDKRAARATTRGQQARAALPALRALIEAAGPALRPGQRHFVTDSAALKFLEAHGTKPTKAFAAIRAALKWRTGMGFDPDEPAERRCAECDADPNSHCVFSIGTDARGWEIVYCCPGRAAHKNPAGGTRHMFLVWEAALEKQRREGREGKLLLLVDLHGMGLRDMHPRCATMVFTPVFEHYPGNLVEVVMLDANVFFKLTWAAIKPALSAEWAARVHMLRGEAMRAYFAAHFDAAQAECLSGMLALKAKPGSYPTGLKALRQQF